MINNSWSNTSPSNAITNAIQSATASGRGGLGTVDIVRGTSGTYTYTWQWSQDKVSWYTVSTSATYSRYVNLGDPTFYLNVSVNSGLATMADTATINVAP